MNQNRKRPSRFEDNMPTMSKNSRPEFGYGGNDVFSSRDMGPVGIQRLPNKTPEQLAFDAEFSKWEKSFEQWKRTFVNHPDRNSYFEYEKKFLNVRDKLLLKRSQIYATMPNPMDALLSAADSFANSILSKFDGGGQQPMMSRSDQMSRQASSMMSRSIPQSMNSRSAPMPLMSLPGPSGSSGWRGDSRDRGGRDSRDNRGPSSRDRMDDRRGAPSGRDRDRRDDRSRSKGNGRDDRRDRDRDIRGGGGRDRGRGSARDRGRGGGGRNDRRSDSRGKGGFGGGRARPDVSRGGRDRERQPAKSIRKPSQKDVDKELARNDVYPLNRWYYCSNVERPALVGKRAKKKNAKILKVIDRKRRIAAGEIVPEEVAVYKPQFSGQEKYKRQIPNDAPLKERIEKLFEEARKADLPKMLPGSGKRRLKNIRAKPETQWDEDERSFVALATYIQEKRSQHLMKKKAEAGESAQAYDPAVAT